ncbi:hypothetical protein MBLNU459_g2132t1 [Dothideomycetes sp. NU459]
MGPPPKPAPTGLSSLRERRSLQSANREASQAITTSDRDPESLFMPRDDDDENRWDPPNYEYDEAEELGWDVNADIHGSYHPTVRDTGSHAASASASQSNELDSEGLPPTQRLSQMHGLFD